MKPITGEWIIKAEGDFHTMERELRARKAPNYDSACFHAQQCCEKYLKAYLGENDINFQKIHDLTILLKETDAIGFDWLSFMEDMAYLTQFGVIFRYPGDSADREMARDARKRCRRFREAVKSSLNIP